MDRQEATSVLRELLIECDGALLSSSVSLASKDTGKFLTKLNCFLDAPLMKCVNAIVRRHGLKMNEQNGKVTLFKRRAENTSLCNSPFCNIQGIIV